MEAQHLTLAEELKRESHRICTLILNSDIDWIDIAIQIERLRDRCEASAPEKLDLFEAIYVSRFNRLWEQWHGDRPETQAEDEPWRPEPLPWERDAHSDRLPWERGDIDFDDGLAL